MRGSSLRICRKLRRTCGAREPRQRPAAGSDWHNHVNRPATRRRRCRAGAQRGRHAGKTARQHRVPASRGRCGRTASGAVDLPFFLFAFREGSRDGPMRRLSLGPRRCHHCNCKAPAHCAARGSLAPRGACQAIAPWNVSRRRGLRSRGSEGFARAQAVACCGRMSRSLATSSTSIPLAAGPSEP
eukprot:193111-Chlamydomonas_euryale.AAC.9